MALTSPRVPNDGPVAVGYSGGMDSTVLLHLLASDPAVRARGLRGLHVDHGLHPDSSAWADQCRATCAALGVGFEATRVRVVDGGFGLEAAARAARHAAFASLMRDGELLALAHHQDDQAETVLLRLLRGSGDGLSGMRALRPFGRGFLWRPLLASPRAELRAWAEARALHWIEDPSNASDRQDRNFLRLHVLPLLRQRWPQAGDSLARSAALLASQAELLAAGDTRRLARIQGLDPATLSVPALLAEPPAWRDRVLRAWIASLGLPPLPTDALATLAAEVLPARPDAQASFVWSGAVLRRWRDHLHAGPVLPELPGDWHAAWDGRAPLRLPTGATLGLEPATAFDIAVDVRARQGGERLALPARAHRSELRTLLQDLGVPPWERRRLPLLFAADGELLAAGDVAVSARLQAWLDARGCSLRLA